MLCAIPSRYGGDDGADWDADLQRLGGDLLQSWRWGEFKRRQGWTVARIQTKEPDGEAMAQALFRRFGPVSLAYLPRGPVIAEGATAAPQLLRAIDDSCARRRVLVLVVEPNQPLPSAWTDTGGGFVRGPESFQTSRTVKVPLLDDAALLAQMRKDTRTNVLHAQRRGVTVERAPAESSATRTFYRLLQETSQRQAFGIHACSYYEDFLRVFGEQAILLFSRVDGVATAGLIAARCGNEGRSMYAGSSTADRGRGDAALLRFEAMQWAREQGCTWYDLGGIAAEAPPASGRESGESRPGSDLGGVEQFKIGFGGEIIAYPPTVERRYRPAMAWLVRRVYPRFRTAQQT